MAPFDGLIVGQAVMPVVDEGDATFQMDMGYGQPPVWPRRIPENRKY